MYRNRYLGMMIAATWLGAFSALIPTWRGKWGRFGLDKEIGSCSILPDKNATSPKEFLFTMAFLVPCLCIIICYARIFYIVRKTALKSHQEPMTNSSLRLPQSKANSRSPAQDTNHSSRRLIEKHSKTSKDEHSENSSSVSTSSGYPQNPPQLHHQYNSLTNKPLRPYLSKVREDEIKFIDTSVESELPPSLSILRACEDDDDHQRQTVLPSERTLPKDTEIQIEKLNDVVDENEEFCDVTIQVEYIYRVLHFFLRSLAFFRGFGFRY